MSGRVSEGCEAFLRPLFLVASIVKLVFLDPEWETCGSNQDGETGDEPETGQDGSRGCSGKW